MWRGQVHSAVLITTQTACLGQRSDPMQAGQPSPPYQHKGIMSAKFSPLSSQPPEKEIPNSRTSTPLFHLSKYCHDNELKG